MAQILSIALNPAIDVSAEAAAVRTTRKIRTTNETYDPGGGGVNVARTVSALGGDIELLYLSGGVTGTLLDGLLGRAGIRGSRIGIAGDVRISFTVFERENTSEYRFVGSGPVVSRDELAASLDAIRAAEFRYCVASGSLPRGAPDDFLVSIAAAVHEKGGSFVVDSSGAGLKAVLDRASVYLVKPSLEELEDYAGCTLAGDGVREVATDLVRRGRAEIVAVTLGPHGALVASAEGIVRLPAIPVEVRSSVGAGDSFLSAMVLALSRGKSIGEATRYGIAGGAAALLRPGTKLCDAESVARLYAQSLAETPAS